jgi:predicted ester cyclase
VVAVRWHVDATHKGDHLGFPASGKPVSLNGSSFLRIRDGLIMDGWNHMDMAGLFRRLQA